MEMNWFGPQYTPRTIAVGPIAGPHRHAVHEHAVNSACANARLLERGQVEHGRRIEDHQIGLHPYADHAAVLQADPRRG